MSFTPYLINGAWGLLGGAMSYAVQNTSTEYGFIGNMQNYFNFNQKKLLGTNYLLMLYGSAVAGAILLRYMDLDMLSTYPIPAAVIGGAVGVYAAGMTFST